MASGLQKTSTYLAIFITALTSVLWITLLLQPRGWAMKITKYYTVDTGVWQVTVSRGAIMQLIPGTHGAKMRKFLNLFTPAVRTTEDFKEYLCGIAEMTFIISDMCLIGNNLHTASIVFIGCVFFGTFLSWSACVMLAMWAFSKPREAVRLWARILYFLSFACYGAGLGQYTGAANSLQDLPPQGDQVAFGRNVYAGMSLCVLQCIPLFVVFVFIGRTREEAINEHKSYKKKEAREETKFANRQYMEEVGYGAAGAGYSETYGWEGYNPSAAAMGGVPYTAPAEAAAPAADQALRSNAEQS